MSLLDQFKADVKALLDGDDGKNVSSVTSSPGLLAARSVEIRVPREKVKVHAAFRRRKVDNS